MKLAIHNSPLGFHPRWKKYCTENNIDYKIVDCYANDIVAQLFDCDALLWHHHHAKAKDVITAKRILFALEHAGVIVFPDFKTNWHFDDKVAQKYLLEAIGAPLVPSYVFYDKQEAMDWVNSTAFPKVFKLKGGAGSANVKLVRTKQVAVKFINKAFGKGFAQYDAWGGLKERIDKFRRGQGSLTDIAKGITRFVYPTELDRIQGREKGYAYFQEFIPNNDSDIRIIVINGKAFGLKRMVRKGDFRASGSGDFYTKKKDIDERCVKIAFETTEKTDSKSAVYDFIFDKNNSPLIVEISYGFSVKAYDSCPGYWDKDLNWNAGQFNPYGWIIEGLIKDIRSTNVLKSRN